MTNPMDELRQASADLQPIEDLTPPPELVQQWLSQFYGDGVSTAAGEMALDLATRAAQWGADHELEACCEWLRVQDTRSDKWFDRRHDACALAGDLRAVRRPKPPSLVEEALEAWERQMASYEETDADMDTIRRALERLQQLEEQQ